MRRLLLQTELTAFAFLLALIPIGSGLRTGPVVKARAAERTVARRVWSGADGVFFGAPSPDGKYVTFTDWETGNLGLREIESGREQLLTTEGSWEEPVQTAYWSPWSPTGKEIVYTWQRGHGVDLRILALDDRMPRVIFRSDDVAWIETHDWSPVAGQILVGIERTDGARQAALISTEDGSLRVLKAMDQSWGPGRFSPDGRYIAYDRTPGGESLKGDLFVMPSDGTTETPIVQHPADDSLVGWDPDGRRVLFSSDRTRSRDLWAIDVADGRPQGSPRRIRESVGRIFPLGFAQTGSFYYAEVKVARDIYAAGIDLEDGQVVARPERAVTQFEGLNMYPRYSPDGKSLAYVSIRGHMAHPAGRGNALCIQRSDTGRERVFFDEIHKLGLRYVAGPRWSPDGRSILFAGGSSGSPVHGGWGIYRVSLGTGVVASFLQLSDGHRLMTHEWSPDGNGFFYGRGDRQEGISQVLHRDLETGEERELFRSREAARLQFAVSPDGRWLALLDRGRRVLELVSTTGRAPHEILRLGRGRFSTPEWTTDGKDLLLVCVGPAGLRGVLLRIPVEGGSPQELGLEAAFCGDRVSLHPDGHRLAYCAFADEDGTIDLCVIDKLLPPRMGAR